MTFGELENGAEIPTKKRIMIYDANFSFYLIIYTAKKEYIRCFSDDQPPNKVNEILQIVDQKMAENEYFEGKNLKRSLYFIIF